MTRTPSRDPDPEEVAAILETAADLIAENGLAGGEMWTGARGSVDWRPGVACCAVGAITIAAGYSHPGDVEDHILRPIGLRDLHPALTALKAQLDITSVRELFRWSDRAAAEAQPARVVDALRAAAETVRTEAGGGR